MINICHQAGGQYAFAHYPEDDAEEEYWKGLVRQTRYLHSVCAVVGLYIVEEFVLNNRRVVVTSVGEKAKLNECDITQIQNVILNKLKGEKS